MLEHAIPQNKKTGGYCVNNSTRKKKEKDEETRLVRQPDRLGNHTSEATSQVKPPER